VQEELLCFELMLILFLAFVSKIVIQTFQHSCRTFSLLNCRPVTADLRDNTCEEFVNVYETYLRRAVHICLMNNIKMDINEVAFHRADRIELAQEQRVP
jgi:hypothetical protein